MPAGPAGAHAREVTAATLSRSPRPLGAAVAVVCLLVVLAGIALGITIIAATGFGRQVSFEHGYPTVVKEG